MSGREKFGGGNSPQGPKPVPRPKENRKKELRADFLLNFQRPPSHQRPYQANYSAPARRSRPSAGGRGAPAAFAKGRFVQSSFRICVDKVTQDVVEATLNADALLDWSSVRRVDLQGDELLKCPICLEEDMVVPKITRCGHVFCVACVMRYFLALQEYNGRFWQKCPVCNTQQVSPEELISVRFEPARVPREGDHVRFVLARRAAASTVVRPPPPRVGDGEAAPRERTRPEEGPFSLPVEGEAGWHFSRLVRLPPGQAGRMLAQELASLSAFRTASLAAGDTELLPSIDAASKLLEQLRREQGDGADDLLEDLELPAAVVECEDDPDTQADDGERSIGPEDPDAAAASDSRSASSAAPPPPSPGTRGSPALGSAAGSPALPSSATGVSPAGGPARGGPMISFYQASDGRLIFLQPFFTKLLLHEHGGWDKLPEELPEVLVEKLQQVTISEETRKRHRFLAHLPLGSQISFAEIDLRSLLSKETKEHFAEEFTKLRQQRKKDQLKNRREERLSKSRAEKEEEKYYHSLNRPHPSTVPLQVVPSKDDFVPLPGRAPAEGIGSADAPTGDAEPGDGGDDGEGEEASGPTLADKLKSRMAVRARPGNVNRFPQLGGGGYPAPAGSGPASSASAAASGTASAWGPGRGSSRATGTVWKKGTADPVPVDDAWDTGEDAGLGMDDQPTFGEALDAALRSRSATANAVEVPGAEEVQADQPDAGAGAKKKKGRAAKATTIRLFG